jgi:hypothetical protein
MYLDKLSGFGDVVSVPLLPTTTSGAPAVPTAVYQVSELGSAENQLMMAKQQLVAAANDMNEMVSMLNRRGQMLAPIQIGQKFDGWVALIQSAKLNYFRAWQVFYKYGKLPPAR